MSETTTTLVGALAAFASLGWGRAQRTPTRVGVLNTGELILVDASERAQVISAPTTALIREQLIHTDFAASDLLLYPQGSTGCVMHSDEHTEIIAGLAKP